MKTSAECLPCLLNRVLEAAAKVTDDPWLRKKVLLDITGAIVDGSIDFDRSPAEVTSDALSRACALLAPDPFRGDREAMNAALLAHHGVLVKLLQAHADPLEAAVRLAAVCNDTSACAAQVDPAALVASASARKFAFGDFAKLRAALTGARRVLYLLDNAGEIVADRILIEAIGPGRVTAVVRRRPLMRDVLEADAVQVGMPCRVITTGSNAAGVPVSSISLEFRRELDHADLIIAKGESAWQTMEEGPWKAFHLLVANCPCTARAMGVAPGSAICLAKEPAATRVTRKSGGTTVARRA